ncbi:alanine--glyoxylate aminotransferase family protein [Ruminococcaceae bacterium OttesenSCG-928-O06]|nr:alanine--glyoxylate aminotransferase family protein [Ruminococcaceae bacterium OttesenSCG-928-O06]
MQMERLVMIPGPTPVAPSIRGQMARQVQAFGDPRFVADYRCLIDELGTLLRCDGQTFPLAGTGTLAMEMAIANTTTRGNAVLVVSNGFFGDRFIDICEGKGLVVDVLRAEWGDAVSPAAIAAQLAQKPYAAVTVSHVDTSTAVCAPIAEIGEVMKDFPDTLYIVDGVAATGGEFEDMAAMHIDVLLTASQKAFGVSPGLFVVWASAAAMQRRAALGTIPEYYVDMHRWLPVMQDPAKYFATPAINLVWAMLESCRIIAAEGYQARAARHAKNAAAAHAGFAAMGLSVLARAGLRASTLSCLLYPEGVDDARFRASLLDEGLIVAGGLGAYAGRMFRMGHMGNIDTNDMVVALAAVERALATCGAAPAPGAGVGAYLAALAT